MSRKHGIRATLPYFLPFPFSPFGTFGAIIRMESVTPSKKALFDTGIAGPLMSFCLSIPAIVIGLKLSETAQVYAFNGETISTPYLFQFIQQLIINKEAISYRADLNPIACAGWVGLFVTALNLLPIGQLDGGHIAYALFGRKSRIVFLIAISAMAFITTFYNPGWLILVILFIVFGFRHPAPMDDFTPLDGKRKLIGAIAFLAFFVSFTPAPFPDFVKELRDTFNWF
jgi:membrane-associated protease RseP (regulator of RpoE activity)